MATKKATALDQMKKLAVRCCQEIAALASLVVEALEAEFSEYTISTSAWRTNTDANTKAAGYLYYADVAVAGVTTKDAPNVILKSGSIAAAKSSGMANHATTVANAVRVYSVAKPTTAIKVQIQIIKGKS